MARTRQKVNPKSADRLKQFYREHKITQERLSEVTGISQNTLSRIANGKAALSHVVATEIVKVFPDIRVEWLMGLDDYRTENERTFSLFSDWNREWKRRLGAVCILAALSGYEINLFPENEAKASVEVALESIKEGYKITKDGQVLARCTLERFNLLALDCQELVEQRIKSYVREVSKDG